MRGMVALRRRTKFDTHVWSPHASGRARGSDRCTRRLRCCERLSAKRLRRGRSRSLLVFLSSQCGARVVYAHR
jgi:hypothetical protein